jgi:hypothetical protein
LQKVQKGEKELLNNKKILNFILATMDNYQFNILKANDQAAFTWEHGTYLAARHEKDFAINLYHVDKFFVEVWLNPEEVKINKIRSFKSKKCLEPYLVNIQINCF